MTSHKPRRNPARTGHRPLLEPLEPRLLLTTATVTALSISNPYIVAYVASADPNDRSDFAGVVTFRDVTAAKDLDTVGMFRVIGAVNVFEAVFAGTLTSGTHTITATYSGHQSDHSGSQATKTETITPYRLLAFGAAPGQHGLIHVFDAHTGILRPFTLFNGTFNGAVNVAIGINRGFPFLVATQGPGGSAMFTLFDPLTGGPLFPRIFDTALYRVYHGGLTVATGDVNGDGNSDIIIGQATGGSNVWEFDATTQATTQLAHFTAFDAAYTGGIRVAAGDVDGDGKADVAAVTASQAAVVSLFNSDTSTPTFTKNFGPGYTGGGYVTLGDFFGTGHDALALTYGNQATPVIQLFQPPTSTPAFTFVPYPVSFKNSGGTLVAAFDIDGDGTDDFITALANSPHLLFINGSTHTHFTALESAFAHFNNALPLSSISGFTEIVR